ncbi:gamma-glutamyl-gamma-aminobutyrate hydrolase family protein [Enterococcus hirae]|nr:gamma-glutamyl-gamma-aminobutyrate hydrolase family protein [Enterococcus hirae]
MKKNIIGIAGNQLFHSPALGGHSITYTPDDFVRAVEEAGGIPLVLPITDPEKANAYISLVDKLLVPGGQDIDPLLYGEEPRPKLGLTTPARDRFEAALLESALAKGRPIFAVCRGFQLLNIVLGGSLYQDLSEYPDWRVKHDQLPTEGIFPTHSVAIAKDSRLAALFSEKARVNSFHHQAIKKLADDLEATAWSADHLIEGYQEKNGNSKIIGVQWHPELDFREQENERKLFEYFVNEL